MNEKGLTVSISLYKSSPKIKGGMMFDTKCVIGMNNIHVYIQIFRTAIRRHIYTKGL